MLNNSYCYNYISLIPSISLRSFKYSSNILNIEYSFNPICLDANILAISKGSILLNKYYLKEYNKEITRSKFTIENLMVKVLIK